MAFSAAWCFPVLYTPPDVPTTPNATGVVDYGWQAMLAALSPVLDPTRPLSAADLFGQIAWTMSGLSNLLFVAVAALLLLQRARPVTARIEVAMWVAIAANLLWFTQGISYLRIGYYLWVLSFVMLELAVHERRRQRVSRTIREKIETFDDESGMGYWLVRATLSDGRVFDNVYINDLFEIGFPDPTPFAAADIVDVEWGGYRGSQSSGVPVLVLDPASHPVEFHRVPDRKQ